MGIHYLARLDGLHSAIILVKKGPWILIIGGKTSIPHKITTRHLKEEIISAIFGNVQWFWGKFYVTLNR